MYASLGLNELKILSHKCLNDHSREIQKIPWSVPDVETPNTLADLHQSISRYIATITLSQFNLKW